MKRMSVVLIIAATLLSLSSCKNSNITSEQIVNLAESSLVQKSYSNISRTSSKDYANYITYDISTDGNYKESSIIIDTFNDSTNNYVRYFTINKDISNNVNNESTLWYVFKNNVFTVSESPFYYDDILKDMKNVSISDDFGQKYYNSIFSASENPQSLEGTIYYIEADINDDKINDYISYVCAPWIQGKDFNISLQINTADSELAIPFSEDIFLNAQSDKFPITRINILKSKTNGFHDVLVETIYKKTGECMRKTFCFDGSKYSVNVGKNS